MGLKSTLVAGLALLSAACGAERRTAPAEATVRTTFSDVVHITPAELALELETAEPPTLLDIREEEEFQVSHLKGAIRVDPNGTNLSALDSLSAEAPIVVYCSIGWRSSEMARRLQDLGFTNVRNLSGSIFRWANEDRPLFADTVKTSHVHPYDEVWGKLLRPEYASYERVVD